MKLLKKCVCVMIAAAFVSAGMVFPASAYYTTDDGNFNYEVVGEPGSEKAHHLLHTVYHQK